MKFDSLTLDNTKLAIIFKFAEYFDEVRLPSTTATDRSFSSLKKFNLLISKSLIGL